MRIVLSNCPPDDAPRLAHALVQEKLAACVNLSGPIRSVYLWDGALQDETETALVAKVPQALVERAVARLAELHPYDVPEILVLPVDAEASHRPYVDWVQAITG